jgi:hypothetical protein
MIDQTTRRVFEMSDFHTTVPYRESTLVGNVVVYASPVFIIIIDTFFVTYFVSCNGRGRIFIRSSFFRYDSSSSVKAGSCCFPVVLVVVVDT